MHCMAAGSYRREHGLRGQNRHAPASTTNVEIVWFHDLEAEVSEAIEAIRGVNFVYREQLRLGWLLFRSMRLRVWICRVWISNLILGNAGLSVEIRRLLWIDGRLIGRGTFVRRSDFGVIDNNLNVVNSQSGEIGICNILILQGPTSSSRDDDISHSRELRVGISTILQGGDANISYSSELRLCICNIFANSSTKTWDISKT